MMKGFLYGQTEYNLLKSAIKIDDYIKKAKECSFDFLSITDSNLYGHYKFYNSCVKNNIKPIIGLEFKFKTIDGNYSKALLYAKSNEGYKNLIKISSKVELEKIELIDDIKNLLKDVYLVFVFNDSFLERLVNSSEENLKNEYFKSIKKNGFYIGISDTNRINLLNDKVKQIAKDYDIPLLPIHQAKYFSGDEDVLEALTKMDGNDFKLDASYEFLDNPDEDVNLNKFINSINLSLFTKKVALPKYENTKNLSSKDFLKALCYKGIQKRNKYLKNYLERLEYELSIIDKMGFNDYFLIVWDYVKYAKQNNILVGFGRGSACGSLVAYALGIIEIDPIEYGLFFERFLNPGRVTMPDIDTDFPDDKREQVIDYVKKYYGDDHTSSIITFGSFQDKLALREVGRIMGFDKARLDSIVAMLKNYTLEQLLSFYENDEELNKLFRVAKKLEGMPRNLGTHPSGIIISSESLYDVVPLRMGNDLFQTQLEAQELEEMGFLKMDFLGISTLNMLKNMMDDINFSLNDLRNIPLNDPKIYQMLQNGDTLGIFQLENEGMRKTLRDLGPKEFNDIVAVIALYRPGPMDNIPTYIRRRHGEKFSYIHKDLMPILNYTYGVIVYQEQIMQIAQKFAGYSLGEADLLRRAVSKKKEELLLESASSFISGAIKHGYDEKIAKEIFDLIIKFANYGFNKAHSVAYATLAYQMLYFKANHFNVFMANMLNNAISDKNKLSQYISYAKARGIVVYKPNINISTNKFRVTKAGLFMPLISVKGVGYQIANDIVDEREKNGLFKNFDDFRNRINISESCIEALIYAGALDCFGVSKKQLINNYTNEQNKINKYLDDVIVDNSEFDFDYLKEMEYKFLSMNICYNIYSNIDELRKKYKAYKLNMLNNKGPLKTIISFNNIKEIKTKKDELMSLGEVEDDTMSIRYVIFPKVYDELKFKIVKSKLYLVLGVIEKNNKNEDTLTILKIAEI